MTPHRTAVTLFSGGRGASAIARELLRIPGIELSVVINGYDNGLSTGALRRYLPGMLGPSDFRKNLLLHLDGDDPRQAALRWALEHRLPPGATRADLAGLIGAFTAADPAAGAPGGRWEPAALAPPVRAAIAGDLSVLLERLDARPGLELGGCALGNLVFAGAYLRLGEDFNAAVDSCVRTFGSPARLLNVSNGENAFLVALKQNGRLLADEADIVAPQDAAPITDLFLLREPLSPQRRDQLAELPADRLRQALAAARAEVSLNAQAALALRDADLIVYGPGTPHSSLLPSYLTPGVADAIAANRAAAKVFVANLREDHDAQGLSAHDLVGRTLAYLDDPDNERRSITHVLCHRPAAPAAADCGAWAGARWIAADLEDPDRPGTHSGRRTCAVLADIVGKTALMRTG